MLDVAPVEIQLVIASNAQVACDTSYVPILEIHRKGWRLGLYDCDALVFRRIPEHRARGLQFAEISAFGYDSPSIWLVIEADGAPAWARNYRNINYGKTHRSFR